MEEGPLGPNASRAAAPSEGGSGVRPLSQVHPARRLSQAELARRTGVSVATIHRLEHGKARARPHVARRLGAALVVDPRDVAELRSSVPEAAPRLPTRLPPPGPLSRGPAPDR